MNFHLVVETRLAISKVSMTTWLNPSVAGVSEERLPIFVNHGRMAVGKDLSVRQHSKGMMEGFK